VIVLERRRTQGAATWSCAAELLDAPARETEARPRRANGQFRSLYPVTNRSATMSLGDQWDEPLGKGRPPVQPAGSAHRLRNAAIFKWLGLVVVWVMANTILAAVHLGLDAR